MADLAAQTNNNKYDVVILGGGASGMATAIETKMLKPNLSVLIIEKNESLGKKLRATGNGRCNISNVDAEGFNEIVKFFTRIGIVTRTYENGLVYPYSESAADVVTLLCDWIDKLGITVKFNSVVKTVKKINNSNENINIAFSKDVKDLKENLNNFFIIQYEQKEFDGIVHLEEIFAENVVLSLGGKAGPNFGTTGDGYSIAKSLGHNIVTPIPVLTAIECKDWDVSLGGIRARGKVSLYKDDSFKFSEDKKIFEEFGEIQFTKTGLSGICVFNMTRFMRYDKKAGESLDQFLIKVDLCPDLDIENIIKNADRENLSNKLCTILKPELANYVVNQGVGKVHELEFHPIMIQGWKQAQATSGGVSLSEIDANICESKLCQNLFITGELLDYDGPCGGFNLSNAWLTAIKASNKIVSKY